MRKRNPYAVSLSKEAGIPYSEAYNEMLLMKWATGLSFADYLKNDLHSMDTGLRFRKAEHIHTNKEKRKKNVEEISELLGADVSEVSNNMNSTIAKFKDILRITSDLYHDYELFKKDDAGKEDAVMAIAKRKELSVRFQEILDTSAAYIAHIDELSDLFEQIKALNSKLLTPTMLNKFKGFFEAVYPQMANDEQAARDISLDFLTLRSAAGHDSLDYKLNDLYNKSLTEKLAFASKREKVAIVDVFNDPAARLLLDDKYSCYLRFRPYFRREIIEVEENSSIWKISGFFKKNPEFIKKPKYSQQGKGIRKVSVREYGSVRKMVHEVLKEDGSFIAEEILKGHPSTSVFNPDSLNTIRILTFNAGKRLSEEDSFEEEFRLGLIRYGGNGIYCLVPFFKTGRTGSLVDNAGSGGVFSAISLADGIGSSIASSEDGRTYTEHPDSGIRFDSLKFNNIDEAVNMVTELALQVPEAGLIGWDLALTENLEWALIEANFSPTFIGQGPAQHGIHNIVHKLVMSTEKSS